MNLGKTIRSFTICTLLLCLLVSLFADVKSLNGVINFDRNEDGHQEMRLNQTGLGIGTNQPSTNLHVVGNVTINEKMSVGSTTIGASDFNVNGTIQQSIDTVSSNATLNHHSLILVNTSNVNITLTLPNAEDVLGNQYKIKKIKAENTISIIGGGYIDEKAVFNLGAGETGSVELISTGHRRWSVFSASGNLGSEDSVASDNLVAWWRLDEVFGASSAIDDGSDADGVNTSTTTGQIGVHLTSYEFDGSNSVVTASVTDGGADTNNATFTAFVKSNALTDLDGILVSRSNGIQGLTLQGSSVSGALSYFWDGAASEYNLETGLDFTINDWYFVAAVIEPTQTTLYHGQVNGTLNSYIHVEANTARSLNGTWTIGHENGVASRKWDGNIDDVRIYNKSLSSEEITQIFNEGSLGYFPNLESATAYDSADEPGLNVGDTLELVFSAATNQPLAGTKAEIDGLVDFGVNVLGADYSGSWNSEGNVLTIVISNHSGNTIMIGETITMIADGTENLKDVNELMNGDTTSVPLEGTFGVEAPGINSIIASDPNGDDIFLDDGDLLTITFDVNTNQPLVGTKAEIDGLIDFGGNIFGTNYTGAWTSPKTLVLTLVDSLGNTLSIGDNLTIIADGTEDLKNAGDVRSASTASEEIEGNFGVIGGTNLIARWQLNDAFGSGTASDDLGLSDGVNNSITAGEGGVLGASYAFDGSSSVVTAFVDHVEEETNNVTMMAFVTSEALTDLDGILVSRANGIQGLTLEGSGQGAELSYFWDGDASEYDLNSGLRFTHNQWYFVAAVVEPTQTTLYHGLVGGTLNSYVHVENNDIRLINGTWYIGQEPAASSRRWDGNIDDVRIYNKSLSSIEINQIFSEAVLKDYPVLELVKAYDTGNQIGVNNGDTIEFVFSSPTNTPLAGTKAEIDGLVDFGGNVLGADYSGDWNADGNILTITIIDASGNAISIGETFTMIADGTENLQDVDEIIYGDTSSMELTGAFGVNAPEISSLRAADPNGDDTILDDGDTITFVFNVDTNEPLVGTKAEIDGLIDFGGNILGTNYTGAWISPTTLQITVVDSTGNTLEIGDTLSIIADGTEDLKTVGDIRDASTASANLNGDFGVIAGTNLISRFKLDEASGASIALDDLGESDGSNTNVTAGEAGRLGTSYEFNGSSSRVIANLDYYNSFTNNVTMSSWVKSDNPTDLDGIFVNRSNGIQGLTLNGNSPNSTLSYFWDGVSTEWDVSSSLEIDASNWYFVAAVISADNTVLYVGDLSGNLNNYVHAEANSENFISGEWQIGKEPATGVRYWDGNIDDVRLYDKSLSPAEIQSIFSEGL